MTNQVTKEGLTDDQMNEHCHLAITEVLATTIINPYNYACQHFCQYNIRNSLSVSVFKNKLEMFHSKKDFLQHVQVKQFLPSFRAPLNIMKILPL